jgi:rubrerythrin
MKEKVPNVFWNDDEGCWLCENCGAEFSAMLADNEVPEVCPYCISFENEEADDNE